MHACSRRPARARNALACERLGAERAINYRDEDFVATLLDVTRGRGVDVVLDMVGGDYVSRNLEVLAMDGRLLQIAFLHGPHAEVNLSPLMRKRITFTGSTLRPRTVEEKGAIARALEREVWPLIESGEVRPVLHAVFPLAEAALAHAELEAGAARRQDRAAHVTSRIESNDELGATSSDDDRQPGRHYRPRSERELPS